jgi:hypothetical protein
MLYEVPVNNSEQKNYVSFYTKTASLLTLDGSELFKNFGCVSFCFREL